MLQHKISVNGKKVLAQNVNQQEENLKNNIIYKREQKAYIKEITYSINQNGHEEKIMKK